MRYIIDKYFSFRKKSEEGFVLIAAIMAVMILIAVGFFALTVTTQDIRISSRLVGERKALSAAEAGIPEVTMAFKMINEGNEVAVLIALAKSNQPIDPANDPTGRIVYDIAQGEDSHGILTGEPKMDPTFAAKIYRARVTGRDRNYGSSATVEIGAAGVFGPGTPIYTNPGD